MEVILHFYVREYCKRKMLKEDAATVQATGAYCSLGKFKSSSIIKVSNTL